MHKVILKQQYVSGKGVSVSSQIHHSMGGNRKSRKELVRKSKNEKEKEQTW
jgi:hypothetical protein